MPQREVPGLGVVTGIEPAEFPQTEQYNGIPYGSIEARFRQSKVVTSWPDNKWDGTKYGPICPFPKIAIGRPLTQFKLPPQHDYDMDEFKCLNLNITTPKGAKPGDDLPVLVFIHGGGNVVGMGSDPGYNGAPMVNFSVERKTPVIIVTLNYRLGAFGYLASKDIQEDNASAGDQGVGNYGIRDSVTAFAWVKKNIKAFGGDPAKVTGAGHSAGSIDTHAIMSSAIFAEQKPFSQAILQSGVASLTNRTLDHQQNIYNKITKHLKLQDKTGPEKLAALRALSGDEMCAAYMALGGPISSWQATVDGYFLTDPTALHASNLPKLKYDPSLKRLLLGDTADEGLIFAMGLMAAKHTFASVHALAVAKLGEADAKTVLEAYGISEATEPGPLLGKLLQLATDAEWSQPVEAVAKSFSNGEVFYYHVAEVNPFDGPAKGKAHHGVDLLFVFMNYAKHLSPELAKLAEVFSGHWLDFVVGKQPWAPYGQKPDGEVTLFGYGPDGKYGVISESVKKGFKTQRLAEKLQPRIGNFAAALRGEVIIE